MKIFSVICLVVIIVGLQHLLNWGWRGVVKNYSDSRSIALIMLTMISVVITFLCVLGILTWGKDLV